MRALLAGVALAAALLIAPAVPAQADPPPDDWVPGQTENGGSVEGGGESNSGNPGAIKVTIPGPWTQKVHTPYCPPNLVRATGRGMREYEVDDPMCGGVYSGCPEGQTRWWLFVRSMGADNRATEDGFRREGVVCRSFDDPDESEPPTITVDQIRERAEALAPTPTFVIEPAAKSFVNIPTNFAAQAEEVQVDLTVLGLTVPVVFTPGNVTWSFGDGTSGNGLGVRNASVGQSGAVEHAYTRSGAYDVTVTVGYMLRIDLPTGQSVSFPTPISRSAAPQSLAVGEIQSVVTEVD